MERRILKEYDREGETDFTLEEEDWLGSEAAAGEARNESGAVGGVFDLLSFSERDVEEVETGEGDGEGKAEELGVGAGDGVGAGV